MKALESSCFGLSVLAIISMAALLAASLSAAQAQSDPVITAWNFENDAIAVNNSPAPSTGTGTASSIGMNLYPTPNIGVTADDVLQGKSSDTGVNGVADTTQTWRVRAQAGANGAANGWSSLAPIGTQGAVFAASTVGYNSINISFDWYVTTQGEANMQLEYTTDGSSWHNVALTLSGSDAGLVVMNNNTSPNTVIGSYVSDNILNPGQSTLAGQDWFTGLTATITDPNAVNDPNFAIEMVNASTGADNVSTQGIPLNNTSGNWRFDRVDISGTVVVPEPSTLGLAGLGLASLIALRQRNRKA
ncbi:MAG: PEP-CTERM sorting domain-containing protein [Verrucomicrobiota bacterium]|jgi:PEP-CTERM motif-containing protein